MSTLAEIREAINRLNEQDRQLLFVELSTLIPEPDENDPEHLKALDEALADVEAGRVHTLEEVRAMIPKWTSKSPSPNGP